MTLQELKISIHKQIDNLNDPQLLKLIDEILDSKNDLETLERSILAGYNESDQGLTKPHDQVISKVKEKYR